MSCYDDFQTRLRVVSESAPVPHSQKAPHTAQGGAGTDPTNKNHTLRSRLAARVTAFDSEVKNKKARQETNMVSPDHTVSWHTECRRRSFQHSSSNRLLHVSSEPAKKTDTSSLHHTFLGVLCGHLRQIATGWRPSSSRSSRGLSVAP